MINSHLLKKDKLILVVLSLIAICISFAICARLYRNMNVKFAQAQNNILFYKDILNIRDGDIVFGDKNAPNTIIEFSDFMCPICRQLFNKSGEKIVKKYTKSGKIKFIIRPFVMHMESLKITQFVICQDRTDSEMLKILDIAYDFDYRNVKYLDNFYKELSDEKIPNDKFYKCINDSALQSKLIKLRQEAISRLHLPGAPIIFVNDKLLYANDNIEKELDAILSK